MQNDVSSHSRCLVFFFATDQKVFFMLDVYIGWKRFFLLYFLSLQFREWFKNNSILGTVIVILAGTHIEILIVLYSGVCPCVGNVFSAPVSKVIYLVLHKIVPCFVLCSWAVTEMCSRYWLVAKPLVAYRSRVFECCSSLICIPETARWCIPTWKPHPHIQCFVRLH